MSMFRPVLGMLLLKKYLKHEVRNECSIATKEDQGEVDVLEFVVVIELEVFVELVKTMVSVLTQGINLEIYPNVIFVRVYFTGPKTVQMRL